MSKGDINTPAFWQTTFFLRQVDTDNYAPRPVPKVTLICLSTPLYFRQRIFKAFDPHRQSNPNSINGVMADPFRIFLVPIMGWYHWNSELFWTLRNNIISLESANGMTGTFPSEAQTPQFMIMHLLAKDTNQAIELLEIAVRNVAGMQQLHARFSAGVNDLPMREAMEQTSSALELSRVRFEGIKARTQAILKRVDNQINLVSCMSCELAQQLIRSHH